MFSNLIRQSKQRLLIPTKMAKKRTLKSNAKGELAVYEPDGIYKPVMTMSKKDGKTYVGTLYPTDLATGERDVASLQL